MFVDTPVEICMQRDPKGLYAKARDHVVRNVTGVDSLYEPPEHPDIVVDTNEAAAQAKAQRLGSNPEATVGGPEQVADALRAYGAAGADWVIVGPVDSSDPDNASLLGELVKPLLA